LVCYFTFLIQLFTGGANEQITISQLVRDIREEKIEKLDVAGQQLRAHYSNDGQVRIARKEEGQQALEVLTASGIDLAELDLEIENLSFGEMLWELVINLLPILLMVVFSSLFSSSTRSSGWHYGFWQKQSQNFY